MTGKITGKKRRRSEALEKTKPEKSAKKMRTADGSAKEKTPVTPRRSSRLNTPTKTTNKSTKKSKTPTKKKTAKSPKSKTPKKDKKTENEPVVVAEKPKRKLPEVPEEEEVFWKHWKQIFLVGTEWETYDSVYDIVWDFDHLNEDLVEGFLSKSPNPKYIFGSTESKNRS